MSPELELFIQEEVESGRFPNREAFLAHAVRLVQLERENALRGIQAGLDDFEAGRYKSLEQTFADLRKDLNLPESR